MRPLPGDILNGLRRGGRDLSILVVRLGALGDVLRTVPAVRLLRSGLPDATIRWVVDDRWASILEGHADLDAVLRLPRSSWQATLDARGGWLRILPEVLRFRRELRALGTSLALDFHGNLRSGIVARISGASVRVGYRGHQQKEGNRLFTNHTVPAGPRRTPRMERNLDLVRSLGLPDAPLPGGALPIARGRNEARRIVESLVEPARRYAILSPGASRKQSYKKPPASLLVAAARALGSRGIVPLVVYGPGEEADAEAVVRSAPAQKAPPTDLHALACLLEGARMFVGGDSGPLHLACAVGCPVLGLYGPTDPLVNAPWGVPHVALHPADRTYTGIKKLDRARGFEGLGEDQVRNGIEELLR